MPIGFSKLIVRLEGRDEIGIAGADHSIRLIERMRARGFQAVGAENLVFGKDESARAEYLVGGTVREVVCERHAVGQRCWVGVEWQVLDVERDAVAYTVVTRTAVFDGSDASSARMATLLLSGAIDRLLDRDGFRRALVPHVGAAPGADAKFPVASVAKCAPGKKLPAGAEDLLSATVVVKTSTGFGSGFLLSADGLVVTAAHVLEGNKAQLRLREGRDVDAVAVRVAPRSDVALLRTAKPLTAHACAAVREGDPAVGADLYAAGAPANLDLAFSLTRGIVSGLPTIEGRRRLQTDAPLSPGNSGGPLADGDGYVVGVVSFKVVARRVEGLGFGVPIREAFDALGLRVGDATDATLATEFAVSTKPPAVEPFHDAPDPIPSLDPEGDQRRARAAEDARHSAELRAQEEKLAEADRLRHEERDRRTPGYIPVLRWTGVATAVVGTVVILYSYGAYDETKTSMRGFDQLRIANAVGWATLGLGTGAFIASYALRPALLPLATTGSHSTLRVGLGVVQWEGTF